MDYNYSSPEYVPVEPENNGSKGIAIAILVLGIVSCALYFLCCCFSLSSILMYILAEFIPFVCGAVGIILYFLKKNDFNSDTIKLARPGFICSIVGVALFIVGILTKLVFLVLGIGFVSLGALIDSLS